MLKKFVLGIVTVLVVAVVAVLAHAATKPDTFNIQRSISIKAPPEKIFVYLNDFQKAAAWVPYEQKDPAMKRQFSGAPSGKGAVYDFEGNRDAGTGRLQILDSQPPRMVALQLDMSEPFAVRNNIQYTLEPNGETTKMTWAMSGSMPYIAKVLTTFCSMDKMVGKDFETGLANLKALAEK